MQYCTVSRSFLKLYQKNEIGTIITFKCDVTDELDRRETVKSLLKIQLHVFYLSLVALFQLSWTNGLTKSLTNIFFS